MKINEKMKMPFTTKFLMKLVGVVLADGEPDPNTPPATPPAPITPPPTPDPTPNGSVNFEELIAKARKEEKDKLYPDIEKWKQKANDHLLVIAERDKEIAKLTERAEKAEKEAKAAKEANTTTVTAEAAARISTLERENESLKAAHSEEIAKKDMEIYTAKKLAEVSATGAGFIPELIAGKTPEEIDASIEASKARFTAITQAAMNGAQIPPANPSAGSLNFAGKKTEQEIRAMNHAQFAAYKKDVGL